jgi:hypothetical protein
MTRSPDNRAATIRSNRLRHGTWHRGYPRTTTGSGKIGGGDGGAKVIYGGPVQYVNCKVTGADGWYVVTKGTDQLSFFTWTGGTPPGDDGEWRLLRLPNQLPRGLARRETPPLAGTILTEVVAR